MPLQTPEDLSSFGVSGLRVWGESGFNSSCWAFTSLFIAEKFEMYSFLSVSHAPQTCLGEDSDSCKMCLHNPEGFSVKATFTAAPLPIPCCLPYIGRPRVTPRVLHSLSAFRDPERQDVLDVWLEVVFSLTKQ